MVGYSVRRLIVFGLTESATVVSGSAMPVVPISCLPLGPVRMWKEVRALGWVLRFLTQTDDDQKGDGSIRQPHWVLRCLQVLTDISWDETGTPNCFDGAETFPGVSRGFGAVMLGYVRGEFSPANMVLYRLWERDNYLAAQQKCDKMYQAHLPGKSTAEARDLAVSQYVQEETDKRADDPSEISPEHISEGVHLILRRAASFCGPI